MSAEKKEIANLRTPSFPRQTVASTERDKVSQDVTEQGPSEPYFRRRAYSKANGFSGFDSSTGQTHDPSADRPPATATGRKG